MTTSQDLQIFLAALPGLEPILQEEAASLGFSITATVPGGVILSGDWQTVWRANLMLRCANRVLVRVGEMRVMHLAQLDKRARRLQWETVLRPDVPVQIEATAKRSRIYHTGAATQRIATAIRETVGAPVEKEAGVTVMARIDNDLCTVSIDTSGEPLHKRGFKQAVSRAPLRETIAASFLRACGYKGDEPVLDPMCGSGTFLIEAAEMARGLKPGRGRDFAFKQLKGFDPAAFEALLAEPLGDKKVPGFYGFDRDAGTITQAKANAERAGVGAFIDFAPQPIAALTPPEGPPGLVIVNPPYGERIGFADTLRNLYAAFGTVMKERFSGWRVGLVTSDKRLAQATGLPFQKPGPPVPHGSLRIRLYQTRILP